MLLPGQNFLRWPAAGTSAESMRPARGVGKVFERGTVGDFGGSGHVFAPILSVSERYQGAEEGMLAAPVNVD